VNYARFWLSLITPNTPKNLAKRRHYAKLVANVGDDLVSTDEVYQIIVHQLIPTIIFQYPVLETAITGRMGLADSSSPDGTAPKSTKRKKSLLELQSSEWFM
jgi:aarF domain-containing kinase